MGSRSFLEQSPVQFYHRATSAASTAFVWGKSEPGNEISPSWCSKIDGTISAASRSTTLTHSLLTLQSTHNQEKNSHAAHYKYLQIKCNLLKRFGLRVPKWRRLTVVLWWWRFLSENRRAHHGLLLSELLTSAWARLTCAIPTWRWMCSQHWHDEQNPAALNWALFLKVPFEKHCGFLEKIVDSFVLGWKLFLLKHTEDIKKYVVSFL